MIARTYDTGVAGAVAHLPGPPEHWSYSTLKEVELCPRRYVLGHATYPELWEGFGYPQTPNPAALFGDIVHDALERVIRALAKAGSTSSNSEAGFAVLQELGGYTAVAEAALSSRLQRLDGNPRVSPERRGRLEQQLERRIPEARTDVQAYLQRMTLIPSPVSGGGAAPPPRHRALGPGSHPEAELRADHLRIKGRIDLLTITETTVDITDHKTGAEDPAHLDQLRFYAMLWDQDEVANPAQTSLRRLTALYPTVEASIPAPNADELTALTEAMGTRVANADEQLAVPIPVASPGEHCGFCAVRSLCDRYWRERTPDPISLADGSWFDFEGVVGQQHGPKSWWFLDVNTGRPRLLLRTTSPQSLVVGQRLRLLGIRREVDPEDQAVVALLTSNSETFVVHTGGDY
jgi:hypothetical protein